MVETATGRYSQGRQKSVYKTAWGCLKMSTEYRIACFSPGPCRAALQKRCRRWPATRASSSRVYISGSQGMRPQRLFATFGNGKTGGLYTFTWYAPVTIVRNYGSSSVLCVSSGYGSCNRCLFQSTSICSGVLTDTHGVRHCAWYARGLNVLRKLSGATCLNTSGRGRRRIASSFLPTRPGGGV